MKLDIVNLSCDVADVIYAIIFAFIKPVCYIGKTNRKLFQRNIEHVRSARKLQQQQDHGSLKPLVDYQIARWGVDKLIIIPVEQLISKAEYIQDNILTYEKYVEQQEAKS